LLEVAVALLGASITFTAIAASGVPLLAAIVTVVILTLAASFGISRSIGLPVRLSLLIACGNSICGNSAIAAVAPVIGASTDDVASSISFTAVLGVIVVLGLPLLIPLVQLTETQYGVLAGMTVYAVPQVLAATIPAGLVSTQIGTLVKLVRVMMLGLVVACVAAFTRGLRRDPTSAPSISACRQSIRRRFMPMMRFGSRWVQAPEIAESNRLIECGNGLGGAKFRVGRGSHLPTARPDASKLDRTAGCRWSLKARSKPLRYQRNAEPLILRLAFRTQPAPTIAIHHSVD
jgi:hypothetical protein